MFSKNKTLIIIFFFVVFFNIVVLSISSKYSISDSSLSGIVIRVVAPIQECINNLISRLLDVINGCTNIASIMEENELLKKKLESKHRLADSYNEIMIINSQLLDLLELKKNSTEHVVAAKIIAYNPSVMSSSVIINKGANAGIIEKSPVIVSSGIVGLVTKVTDNYSKILLLTDPISSIDVLIQRNNIKGVVEGCGNDFCTLEYVSNSGDIIVGDVVVSSGLDGVFPKGMKTGSVSKVIYNNSGLVQKIFIDPCVKINSVQFVLVLVPRYKSLDDF